jgi:hypothetical protein
MDDTTITPASGAEPVELAPMSTDEADRAIENLLSGGALPKGDNAEESKAQASTEPSDDDDGLVIEEDDDDAIETAPAPAKPVITDDLMVEVDGKQISLGELKRGTMFQRDYTFKTEQLKTEKQQLETWKAEEANRLAREREQVYTLASVIGVPQPPDPTLMDSSSPNYDPLRFMEEEARFKQKMGVIQSTLQQEEAKQAEAQRQQKEAVEQRRIQEQEKLHRAIPKLKDAAYRDTLVADIKSIIPAKYGLDASEVLALENAGAMQIVIDAIKYQKALAKGKTVVQELPTRPKLEGRQRSTPMTQLQRDSQGRFEALRKTGSVEAADRAIEAFLLKG